MTRENGMSTRAGGSLRPKLILYHISKRLGLFALAARLNRGRLPILCYHGFALSDENRFRPRLFMSPKLFEQRMSYLKEHGYQVFELGEAIHRLREGRLPDRAVVITIDDGFHSVAAQALPILKRYSFPATVYVSSYYVEKGTPVFRLALQYIFWKTSKSSLDLGKVLAAQSAVVDLRDPAEQRRVMWDLIEYGENKCNEPGRCELNRRLAQELGVDYENLVARRGLSLMNSSEIQELIASGSDIQLHTHRHRFPENRETAWRELADNQRSLERFSDRPLKHFCYPSGLWSRAHWPWLAQFGILTATTCEPGLNASDAPAWGLKRFLDADHISQIEFEAGLCGFSQFLKSISSLWRSRRPDPSRAAQLRPSRY